MDELWAMPRETALAEIIRRNTGLIGKAIQSIAARRGLDNSELDDLRSDGHLGLMKAIRNFDPGRGNQFSTYAYAVIWGHMMSGLSGRDWVSKPARVAGNTQRMTRVSDFRMECSSASTLAVLRGPRDEQAQRELESVDQRIDLAGLLAKLPKRDRQMVSMRVVRGLKLRVIAKKFGLSKEAVRKTVEKSLQALRDRVKQDFPDYVPVIAGSDSEEPNDPTDCPATHGIERGHDGRVEGNPLGDAPVEPGGPDSDESAHQAMPRRIAA